jgi:hypothetical protein
MEELVETALHFLQLSDTGRIRGGVFWAARAVIEKKGG